MLVFLFSLLFFLLAQLSPTVKVGPPHFIHVVRCTIFLRLKIVVVLCLELLVLMNVPALQFVRWQYLLYLLYKIISSKHLLLVFLALARLTHLALEGWG